MKKISDEYKQYLIDLRSVASTPQGMRVLSRLLGETGVFGPRWHQDARSLERYTALGDFGQNILRDLMSAEPTAYERVSRLAYSEMGAINLISDVSGE